MDTFKFIEVSGSPAQAGQQVLSSPYTPSPYPTQHDHFPTPSFKSWAPLFF